MDEAELKDLIPPKEENPLLKRKPLNLGNQFKVLSSVEDVVEWENPLIEHEATVLFFAAEWVDPSQYSATSARLFCPP